jgi:low affinity Fe/Cu permease
VSGEADKTADHDELPRGDDRRGGEPLLEARFAERRLKQLVQPFARAAPGLVGSTAAFVGLVVATIVWVALGPFVDFSSGWLLVPSAVASILALLLVVLLQYSQNRDTRALQLKLDEVIRAVGAARSDLLRLERLSDEELTEIEREFDRLRHSRNVRQEPPAR